MARTPNAEKSATLSLQITPTVHTHLKRLVALGMFGKTPSEVATGILYQALQRMVEKGHLKHRRLP
ncbi:MAG: hypothetical protein KGO02_12565 [Alphaproteobacteria bacterium]|nr:hypothetical protein [Alphaproteobacteria bacterium]